MKKLDLVCQSVIIALTLFLFATGDGTPIWLGGLLALGIWQGASCLISIISKAPFFYQKLWHITLLILYSAVFSAYERSELADQDVGLMYTLRNVLPFVLAVYYYVITWKWCFRKLKQDLAEIPINTPGND